MSAHLNQFTQRLDRTVRLRPGTSDQQVWAETFTGLHHLPPDEFVPATILDLGANIGLVAAHYRALWPDAKIVAVEMDKECCDMIHRNAPGVEVVPSAVSATGGWGSYNQDLPAYERRFVAGDEEQGTLVHSRTLPDLIDSHFLHGVDLVKMDVEGAEWGLFETADRWAPLARRLLAELHGDATPDALVQRAGLLLQAADYTVARHPGHPQAVWATR